MSTETAWRYEQCLFLGALLSVKEDALSLC